MLTADELTSHLRGCSLNQRESQKKIYNSFYGYAMSICDRYCNREDDAMEILNDGFLKVFKEVDRFKPSYSDAISSFKGWLRKIMIYTAIDHYRKHHKHHEVAELDNTLVHMPAHNDTPYDKLSYDEIIRHVQQLTPAYRAVLNLFIVEGFSHEEIAEMLNISVGTSKSNLAKARKQLQKILFQNQIIQIVRNAG